MRVSVLFVGLGIQVAGCVPHTPNMQTLRTRAAFDLDCPETQLATTKLSPEVYGVSGCGKRATYVNSPRSWDDWYMNSEKAPAPVDGAASPEPKAAPR
jgi:hypothetical protein